MDAEYPYCRSHDEPDNALTTVNATALLPSRSHDRHGEVKGLSMARIRRRPQPSAVCLHDRSADSQPHPHSLRLGGVKCIEDAVTLSWNQPDSGVADRYSQRICVVAV